MRIPVHESNVTFLPDRIEVLPMFTGGGIHQVLLQPFQEMMFFHRGGPISMSNLFMAWHPGMQYSQPVSHVRSCDQGIGFSRNRSFAIMRNAATPDLAWEFLRFIITVDECLNTRTSWNSDLGQTMLPVNRARFYNQVGTVLNQQALWAWGITDIQNYVEFSQEEFIVTAD